MPKITKNDAAKILDKSERAVERYSKADGDKPPLLSVTYEKGTTRDVPMYDEEEVRELAERLRNPQTAARGVIISPEGQQTAMATRTDNADKFVAIIEHLVATSRDNSTATAQATIGEKIMLTLADASALTNLSKGFLVEAVHEKKLKAKKLGRGWKIKRTDLDAYIKKL
jgi:excisionase family DNA binding protein